MKFISKTYNFFKKNILIILILVLASILRFYHLDFQSMWLDELFTMAVTNPDLSWKQFLDLVIEQESFPYLYFVLVKFFHFIFGYSSLAPRILSALAGILSVYCFYLLGKKIYSKNVGLTAALLISVNSFHIYISQDARAYSLYFLLVCLSFYQFLIWIKKRTWKNTILYAIASGLLLNINYFATLNVFSQGILMVIVLFLLPKNQRIDFIKKAGTAIVLIFFCFIINYKKIELLLNFKHFWIAPPKDDSFSVLFKNFFGSSEIIIFLILPFIIYYVFLAFRTKEPKKWTLEEVINNKPFSSFIIFFVWFLTIFAFLFIKSYGPISYLLTRYFLSILPVIILMIAIAIVSSRSRIISIMATFTLAFFMFTHVLFVSKYYTKITKTQYREAANYLIKNRKKQIPIYSDQSFWYNAYFYNHKKTISLRNYPLNNIVAQLKKYPHKKASFYYLDAFRRYNEPKPETVAYLKEFYTIKREYNGYRASVDFYELKN